MPLPLAIAIGSFAIQAGRSMAAHRAQNKQHTVNRELAERAGRHQLLDLSIRGVEEGRAARQALSLTERQATEARSLARVSAAESGVQGAAVDLLLNSITRDEAEARLSILDNLGITLDSINRAREGVMLETDSRISSVPRASTLATGLNIGAAGLNALALRQGMTP